MMRRHFGISKLLEQMKALGGVGTTSVSMTARWHADKNQSMRSTERLLEGLSAIPKAVKMDELWMKTSDLSARGG